MSINAKSVKVLATAAFAIPMFVFAEHDWQGVSLDESAQAYLTSIGSNWNPANVPNGDSLRFMKGGTTVTFDSMINAKGYVWTGATGGEFTGGDGEDLWCVWQSLGGSGDYGISANCKLAVSDAADQRGNLWIKSGSYTFSNLDFGLGNGPAKVKVDGGSLTSSGPAYVAGKPEAKLEIGGGHLKVNDQMYIANVAGATGIVHVTSGTITNTSWLVIGQNTGYHESIVRIDGGEVYNQGNTTLGSQMGNGSKDNLVVAGTGVLRTTGNIYIAEGYGIDSSNPAEATVTVEGGLVDNSAGETQFFMNNSIAGTTGTLDLKGGEYITKQIQHDGKGAGTAVVKLGGGTLTAASGADAYIIYAASGKDLSVTLVDGTTSTININGQILHINVPINGAGTLRVSGGGTLSLSKVPSSPISVVLDDNVTLVVQAGTEFSSLSVGNNAKVVFSADTYEEGIEFTAGTISSLTVPVGEGWSSHVFLATGSRTVNATSMDGSAFKATVSAAGETDAVATVWIGKSSKAWGTADNWTAGVPTAYDTAWFYGDAEIERNSSVSLGGICITNSATLYFNRTSGDPETSLNSISGNGTLKIMHGGLMGQTTDLVVESGITIKYMPYATDSWMKENNGHKIVVHGTIDASEAQLIVYGGLLQVDGDFIIGENKNNYISSEVTFNGRVAVENGAPLTVNSTCVFNGDVSIAENSKLTIKAASCQFNGNTVVDGVFQNDKSDTSFVSGKSLSGSGTINLPYRAQIHSNISGPLAINLTGWSSGDPGYTDLTGNNENFTGTLVSKDYHIVRLGSINSGSPNATWNISTDCRYVGTETGTLKFGALNLTKVNWNYFYLTKGLTGLVLEVGHLNTDMIWGNGYNFGTYNQENGVTSTSEHFDGVIRKVGTGTLSTYADHYSFIEFNGGVVAFKDSHGPSNGTAGFKWTGGTLRFDVAYNWDPTPRFDCANSTVVDIDTAGYDFTWGTALTDTVGITKRGDGVLTLTGAHTYTGNTTVLGGTLVLPLNTGVGTLAVADGATLAVDCSSLENVVENTPYEILSGSTDSASIARIRVANSDWDWTTSSADGKISATAEAWGDVPNVWVGGEEGYWKDSVNWSRNIAPQGTHTAMFTTSALVYLDGDKTMSSIDVASGARVLVKSTNISGIHPTLRPATMTGSGTVALHHAGIIPSVAMTIPDTLTIEIEKVNDGNTIDSWLEGDTAETALTINAPIIGDGYIIFRDHIVLAGDNSGFTGKVVKDPSGTLTFTDTKSGSAAAAWEFQGDVNTAAITEGTLSFGSLTLSGQKCWYQNSNSTMTIEIGALGLDMQFGGNFFFGAEYYDTGTNPENVTLKVVGGKLTYASYGMRKIEVAAGEMVLAAPTHGDGHWTSYRDNHAGYQIDSLVVRSGAALSGSSGDQKILSATFGNGSILKTTLEATSETVGETTVTTYSASPVPAVEGTVDVSGIHVQVANPAFVNDIMSGEDEAAKSALASTVFPLLEAGAVSGKVTLDSELTGLGTKVWRTCNSATSLGLCCRNAKFVFLVR